MLQNAPKLSKTLSTSTKLSLPLLRGPKRSQILPTLSNSPELSLTLQNTLKRPQNSHILFWSFQNTWKFSIKRLSPFIRVIFSLNMINTNNTKYLYVQYHQIWVVKPLHLAEGGINCALATIRWYVTLVDIFLIEIPLYHYDTIW